MNFIDQVRNWPPITDELKLYVELVYGKPRATEEYLAKLPDIVVEMAYRKIESPQQKVGIWISSIPVDLDRKRVTLSWLLDKNTMPKTTADAITEALCRYHQLLG